MSPSVEDYAYDQIDLQVDGSTPVNVSVDMSKFSFVRRCIIRLKFQDNALDWDIFSSGSILANGIQFFNNDNDIAPVMKTNADLGLPAYDIEDKKDDSTPFGIVLLVRWTFTKAIPAGIRAFGDTLHVKVSDDLRAITRTDIKAFTVMFEGGLLR